MAANYARLWKLLIDRNINKTKLREMSGISTGTLAKLGKNEYVSTEVLDKICTALDISPDYLLLGRISDTDRSILTQKIACLTPEQYRHLEDIIDSFIAVATEK